VSLQSNEDDILSRDVAEHGWHEDDEMAPSPFDELVARECPQDEPDVAHHVCRGFRLAVLWLLPFWTDRAMLQRQFVTLANWFCPLELRETGPGVAKSDASLAEALGISRQAMSKRMAALHEVVAGSATIDGYKLPGQRRKEDPRRRKKS